MPRPQPQTSATTWAIISGACLVLGLAVGYVVFGHRPAQPVTVTPAAQAPAAAPQAGLVDERQLQALRDILARDPKNLQATMQLGNMLYDAGRYAEAVPAYQQAFALDPTNINVSTDLGTALWYSGQADAALAQYEKSLAIDPTHAQTLFNQGIVRHDGKLDHAKALQSWEKLLASNPDYPDRAKVQQLIDQTRQKVQTTPIAPTRSSK
ncbi:MAG: tetratricopeptide repeat protein [Acidobacteria bacterium]|nr:MAG: tetratricopeptide repeat protein [Acidobacteriota bacterium]RPJ84370.1 MAG: tetratricopeptide repeat protein [Acidobacteriota bacterium]